MLIKTQIWLSAVVHDTGLLKAMAVAVVAYNSSREGQQKDPGWFGRLFTEPLLKIAARYQVTSRCSSLVVAVLS